MKDIVIYGAGGLGREVACIINQINQKAEEPLWNLLGFYDDGQPKGLTNDYGSILGALDDLVAYPKHISVIMGIATPMVVSKIVSQLKKNPNIDFPNIISPDLEFFDANNYSMGEGNFVNKRCMMSINTHLGNFNSLGAGTTIGHDAHIGDFNVFMPMVQICGHALIGCLNFFGLSSIMLQDLKVNEGITLGAASILMKDATIDNATYFGNPARVIIKK